MYFSSTILATVAALAGSATSAILWDGRFNDLSTSTDLNNWSWANQVGPYQYYIHGSGAVTEYVNLASTYKNPADTGSKQGAKISLTSTAYWNGQTMRRTELIPQTSAAIASGTVWYHFSIKRSDVNPPSTFREHQIAFFESHFTELKYGGSGGSNTLRWCVSGADKWTTPWTADVWHNVAYEINFAAGSVAFWHSTGSDPLTLTVPAVSVSASSNGADWHVGVLELPVSGQADANEDYYFSGVYIESGSLTKTVAGPGGVVSSSSATGPVVSTTAVPTTLSTATTPATSAPATTAPSTGGTLAKWSQCGGQGWSGSGTCVAGTTCTAQNSYYSQCL